MKRLGEVLGILIVVALGFQFLSTPQEATVRPSIPREELNISGIRLGDSLEKVEELYGEPDSREDGGGLRWRKTGLEVRVDFEGVVYFVCGNSLSHDVATILSTSDAVEKGFSLFGPIEEEQKVSVPAYCGFSPPTTRRVYCYRDLGLYVESESEGFIWESEEQLSRFVLSDRELVVSDGFFPNYKENAGHPER